LNNSQKFNVLYEKISKSIDASIQEINTIDVNHEDGKKEISNIMEKLQKIKSTFDDELNLLKDNAEWDKFTVAFFGETNAGKSTIIESLRILFNEDSRQKLLQDNAHSLEKYELALNNHVSQARDELYDIYEKYTVEVNKIHQSATVLKRILEEESSSRINRKLWFFAIIGCTAGTIVTLGLTLLLRG
jgi:hypothetical protein